MQSWHGWSDAEQLQIGGSLAKLVYFSREPNSAELGGRLNFISFETERIDSCLSFMQQLKVKQQKLNGSNPAELCVMATGGGAYKYYEDIRKALGVEVLREDEMECLIIGSRHVSSKNRAAAKSHPTEQDWTFSSPRSQTRSLRTAIRIRCILQNLTLTSTHISW